MKLNPNDYMYIINTIKAAAANSPYKSLYEVASEIAVTTHVPLVAALTLCKEHIGDSAEITAGIERLRKFYKYEY